MLISVVIVNWNGKEHLKNCLSSMRQQTFRSFEVVLVDNGSADGSVEYVRENFPEVHLIKLDRNYGFGLATNRGIAQAKGEFIACLNNDTEVDAHWLEELYHALTEHKEIGFCASKMLHYTDRSLIDTAGDTFSIVGKGIKRGWLERDDGRFDHPEEVFGACAGAAIYRRSLLTDVGLFDEDLFHTFEDVDLSLRARLTGYSCLFVPRAIVYHKVAATRGLASATTTYLEMRNLEYVYLKNIPAPLLLKYGLHHLLYFFYCMAVCGKRGQFSVFLKGKLSLFFHLRHILQKRREIARRARVSWREFDGLLDKRWHRDKLRHFLGEGWSWCR